MPRRGDQAGNDGGRRKPPPVPAPPVVKTPEDARLPDQTRPARLFNVIDRLRGHGRQER